MRLTLTPNAKILPSDTHHCIFLKAVRELSHLPPSGTGRSSLLALISWLTQFFYLLHLLPLKKWSFYWFGLWWRRQAHFSSKCTCDSTVLWGRRWLINPYQLLRLDIAVPQKGQSCDLEATTVNTVNYICMHSHGKQVPSFMHLILNSNPAALVQPAFCIQSIFQMQPHVPSNKWVMIMCTKITKIDNICFV